MLSRKSNHFVWVPPHGNRVIKSLPDTIPTLMFGWWSLMGFAWTIEALTGNFNGGRDVTQELLETTQGGDVALAQQAVDSGIKAERRQSIRAVIAFLAILALIGILGLIFSRNSSTPVAAREAPSKTNAAGEAKGTSSARAVPLKNMYLQAILFNPAGRSTVIINGNTLAVGENAGGYTVLAISQQSVTLQANDGTKWTLDFAGSRR